MVQTKASWIAALSEGVHAWYGLAVKEHMKEYDKIFETFKSSKYAEWEYLASGYGYAQVMDDGGSVTYDEAKQGFKAYFQHVKYGLGFKVSEDAYKDNLYKELGLRNARRLARSLNATREKVGALVLDRAFSGTYTGPDGLALCSTAHLNTDNSTYSNKLTTDADLSETSLEQACVDIGGFVNDRGIPMPVAPVRLIIHRSEGFNAERILNSLKQNDTANNAVNALKSLNAIPGGFHINHYVTDEDAWFLVTDVTTAAKEGMKYFERYPDKFDDDNEFDTNNAKFKAVSRYCFGWSDPKGIFGSQGA